MYNIQNFCNVIFNLRKNKDWTQGMLADKLGISPQSISKWECGVGYPDVTLFPVIADLFNVPISTLFGEEHIEASSSVQGNTNTFEFSIPKDIKVYIGNICRVEFIDKECESCEIRILGDETFMRCLSAEKEGQTLFLHINNPSGLKHFWEPYDRCGYDGENLIQIYTDCRNSAIETINYLDLVCTNGINADGNYQVIVTR